MVNEVPAAAAAAAAAAAEAELELELPHKGSLSNFLKLLLRFNDPVRPSGGGWSI